MNTPLTPVETTDLELAGTLLRMAEDPAYPRSLSQYADRLAREVAAHGLAHGQGWLAGLWYIGGNHLLPGAGPLTYHDVVASLQGLMGLALVTPREDADLVEDDPYATDRQLWTESADKQGWGDGPFRRPDGQVYITVWLDGDKVVDSVASKEHTSDAVIREA